MLISYDTESKITYIKSWYMNLAYLRGYENFTEKYTYTLYHLHLSSQSQIGRQISLFAFYDLRNDNSRRRNRRNLCLCGSDGNVLRQLIEYIAAVFDSTAIVIVESAVIVKLSTT